MHEWGLINTKQTLQAPQVSKSLLQVYTRLNQLNITTSYTDTLKAVNDVSCIHKVPLQQWIADGITFKFVGDNVDKKKGVRDIRSDHQGKLHHMFSMLLVRDRILAPPLTSPQKQPPGLSSLKISSLLPTPDDVKAIHKHLEVLVSRVLCKYMKPLAFLAKVVPSHIQHKYSQQTAQKSETVVLGDTFPGDKQVLSGGDQLTCERQRCARRHMMDANTPRERLQLLEPVVEDWHTMQSFLGVSNLNKFCFPTAPETMVLLGISAVYWVDCPKLKYQGKISMPALTFFLLS